MSPPGRPKGEYRSAKHEGTSMNAPVSPPAELPDALAQLGRMTRQLQDMLGELGGLRQSAQGLPDARARLQQIEAKAFAAADKVLGAVEQAKGQRARIEQALHRLAALLPPPRQGPLQEIEAAAAHIDQQLTEIMVAQDFHDLSAQLLAKVGALAIELEAGLTLLLRHGLSAAGDAPLRAEPAAAASQREVDELLASLGM
jgi:chemotaxis protein CheZ